jgi:hypothetical protein
MEPRLVSSYLTECCVSEACTPLGVRSVWLVSSGCLQPHMHPSGSLLERVGGWDVLARVRLLGARLEDKTRLVRGLIGWYTGCSANRSAVSPPRSWAVWPAPHCYGARGSVVLKALCYKSDGRGFETRRGECIFLNLPNPSGRTRPWGLFGL